MIYAPDSARSWRSCRRDSGTKVEVGATGNTSGFPRQKLAQTMGGTEQNENTLNFARKGRQQQQPGVNNRCWLYPPRVRKGTGRLMSVNKTNKYKTKRKKQMKQIK